MIYAFGTVFFILLIYAPTLWVRFVLWRHSRQLDNLPGTGGELALHLIERFSLDGVSVVEGIQNQDHYNSETKVISLSPSIYGGKSLTAVAVATHEVGHAIQFTKNEPICRLRNTYLKKAFQIKRIGSGLMIAMSLFTLVVKIPHLFIIAALIGVITMLASALMYVAILPEEYDASFNKALPILAEGYVSDDQMPAVRQVLRAAALTYVAGALADVIRLWRWIRYIR